MIELYEQLTHNAVNPAEVNERATKLADEMILKIRESKDLEFRMDNSKKILDIVAIVSQVQTAESLSKFFKNKEIFIKQLHEEKDLIKAEIKNPYQIALLNKNDSNEKKLKKCHGIIDLLLISIENKTSKHMRLSTISGKELHSLYSFMFACEKIYKEIELDEKEKKDSNKKRQEENNQAESQKYVINSDTKDGLEKANERLKVLIEKKNNFQTPNGKLEITQIQYSKYDEKSISESTISNKFGEKISIKKLGKLNFLVSGERNDIDKDIYYYDVTKYDKYGIRKSKYQIFSGELIEGGLKLENSYEYYPAYLKAIADYLLSDQNLIDSVINHNKYVGDVVCRQGGTGINRYNYKQKIIDLAKSKNLLVNSEIGTNRII